MKLTVDKVRLVAAWTWDAGDDACGICRNAFDSCCPDCNIPGDACPIVWGDCKHPFHHHCISKWVGAQPPEQQKCPMCRQDWAPQPRKNKHPETTEAQSTVTGAAQTTAQG